MATSKAQQAAKAISMKKAGSIPKGYHKMPDGTVMKNSAHKKPALKKAQKGTQIGQGPNNTVAKSNINAKIAAGVGAVTTAIGLVLNKRKKNKEIELQKLKAAQTPEQKRGGAVKAKMKK